MFAVDSLLNYDEEENNGFVKDAQENLRLMEKEMIKGGGDVDDSSAGCETFRYIDFSHGELNVLDENYFPPMSKYSYLPLRKVCRTGLICRIIQLEKGPIS